MSSRIWVVCPHCAPVQWQVNPLLFFGLMMWSWNISLKQLFRILTYLPTLPVFPGVSKFFIKSPGLPVRASNLPGNTHRGLFQNFFINFVIFKISKRKIKQEVGLVFLFELFSIGKRKTEEWIKLIYI